MGPCATRRPAHIRGPSGAGECEVSVTLDGAQIRGNVGLGAMGCQHRSGGNSRQRSNLQKRMQGPGMVVGAHESASSRQ